MARHVIIFCAWQGTRREAGLIPLDPGRAVEHAFPRLATPPPLSTETANDVLSPPATPRLICRDTKAWASTIVTKLTSKPASSN
jgi:hypothetical protein